jgi:hypothetical protein
MGKGGCTVATMGRDAIRACCCCFLLLALSGPSLVAIGILTFTADNHFESRVAQYNAAVTRFSLSSSAQILRDTMVNVSSSVGSEFQFENSPVVINGDRSNAVAADSAALQSVGHISMASDSAASALYVDQNPTTRKFGVSLERINAFSFALGNYNRNLQRSRAVMCPAKTDDGLAKGSDCAMARMDELCQAATGAACASCGSRVGATRAGSTCACVWYEFPAAMCKPLRYDAGTAAWSVATDIFEGACDYHGQRMQCFTMPSTLPTLYSTVRFLAANDPYIALQAVTEGTGSFGITALQQRMTGGAFILIGLMILMLSIGIAVLCCRSVKKDPAARQRALSAVPFAQQPVAADATQPNGSVNGSVNSGSPPRGADESLLRSMQSAQKAQPAVGQGVAGANSKAAGMPSGITIITSSPSMQKSLTASLSPARNTSPNDSGHHRPLLQPTAAAVIRPQDPAAPLQHLGEPPQYRPPVTVHQLLARSNDRTSGGNTPRGGSSSPPSVNGPRQATSPSLVSTARQPPSGQSQHQPPRLLYEVTDGVSVGTDSPPKFLRPRAYTAGEFARTPENPLAALPPRAASPAPRHKPPSVQQQLHSL